MTALQRSSSRLRVLGLLRTLSRGKALYLMPERMTSKRPLRSLPRNPSPTALPAARRLSSPLRRPSLKPPLTATVLRPSRRRTRRRRCLPSKFPVTLFSAMTPNMFASGPASLVSHPSMRIRRSTSKRRPPLPRMPLPLVRVHGTSPRRLPDTSRVAGSPATRSRHRKKGGPPWTTPRASSPRTLPTRL